MKWICGETSFSYQQVAAGGKLTCSKFLKNNLDTSQKTKN